jgi:iron complex transport system ATP-binding protein
MVGYKKTPVVSGMNLEMLDKQCIGVLGPNGSGKSTILKTLLKMLSPLGGVARLKDKDLQRIPQKEFAQTVAAVLTEPLAPGLLTAFDIAAMGRYPYTSFLGRMSAEDTQKTWETLETVGCTGLAHRYFDELSDGEKQKVLVARALAQEPELIVLDEPTSHLDSRYRIEVMLILRRLVRQKNVTVLASLHDVDLAMKVCDVVLLVKNGEISAFGPPEEVLTAAAVNDLYGLTGAGFNTFLGGIDLRSEGEQPVFVIAGSGSGAQLYRTLVKNDFTILTGVLPKNDIDFHVAQAVGAHIVAEEPYEDVCAECCTKALDLMDGALVVVDAGFPVGRSNRRNVDLVVQALEKGKTICSLRSQVETLEILGTRRSRGIHFGNISTILTRLRNGEDQQ